MVTQTDIPRVTHVRPDEDVPFVLHATFADGGACRIDMTGVVHRLKAFAPLRDPAVFRRVRIINAGGGIAWSDDLDYSAGALRRLGEEQTDMTGVDLAQWMDRMRLSNAEAAEVLGTSDRTVKAYKTKETALPASIAIACRAMERDRQILLARLRHVRVPGRPPRPQTQP
ncbi:DUF2442 domain-containing protein [Caenispirillum bisanense]|uniref:DUF2442 domain-containing protein n=1 Tax=Caenispirillum bisanense TaxID=414052 RepID=A0A286GLT2_9PROT|nr:DUF2442 domain-containing protein [Caenispirillum bisanense]SOD96505.1 Protein of unknown function [Caenispirillum bisanense]